MNILVTSSGRRVKIIEYFKKTLDKYKGKVITTDCDSNAPALYFADDYEIVPKIDHPNYINILLKICLKYNINAIVSLIDPELELLAKHKQLFDEKSIQLVLSHAEMIKMTFDKYETYRYLKGKGIPVVPTYDNLDVVKTLLESEKLSFPFIVKPAKGSASIGIYKVDNEQELINIFNKENGLVIQPFYKDKEFGVDVYIDLISGKLVDLFIKEKIRMRSGETDKSISRCNNKIEKLVKDLISHTDFLGPIDIDCFEFNDEYYISEINPRFGGGYPHAYELGCDFMTYIINNLNGNINAPYQNYNYKKDYVMMKYDNIKIKNY